MKNKPSILSFSSLAALLAIETSTAATIDVSLTPPDVFDGVQTDYLLLANSAYAIGVGSIAIGPSATALGEGSISLNASVSGYNSIGLSGAIIQGEGSIASGDVMWNYGNHSIWFSDASSQTSYGNFSIAVGSGAYAESDNSAAFGTIAAALGVNSFATGSSKAHSSNSSSFGNSEATGIFSSTFGEGSLAFGRALTVVGKFNLYPTDWGQYSFMENDGNPDGHLFVVGNGSSDISRSNALEVNEDGSVDVQTELRVAGDPVLTQPQVEQYLTNNDYLANDSFGDLRTQGYIDSGTSNNVDNFGGSYSGIVIGNSNTLADDWGGGLYFGVESSGIIGNNNSLNSAASFVTGQDNSIETWTSINSFITGARNTIDGGWSNNTIHGADNTITYGGSSLISGNNNSVAGSSSFVTGYLNQVNESLGNALGKGLIVDAVGATAIGYFNSETGATHSASDDPEAPLFIVGNGTGDPADGEDERSDALIVKRNGDVIIPKPQGDVSMGIYGE